MKTKRKINFQEVFYIFVITSIFGWIVEFIFFYIRNHIFVNHSSLVIGPFSLAYGFGGALLTLLLYNEEKSSLKKVFAMSFLSATVLEYIMSFGMELVMGFCAWDYSNLPLNINGRVCLLYSLFWGFLGIGWIRVIYPFFQKHLKKLNNKLGRVLMYFLIVFFILDALLTISAFERMKKERKGIAPKNKYEEFLDYHFGYDYLNDMYIHVDQMEERK